MSPKIIKYLQRHIPQNGQGRSVLEIGSANVTGECRSWLISKGFNYTGADIEKGDGVDVVIDKSCLWDLGRTYDIILSLNTFEHVDKPWILIKTMANHLSTHGNILLVAPFSFQFHRHPIDCWRYTPDTMKILADIANVRVITSYLDYEASATYGTISDMCWLVLRKRLKDAIKVLSEWRTRPPAWNCIGLLGKS